MLSLRALIIHIPACAVHVAKLVERRRDALLFCYMT
jgi:hypothetical protein